MAAIRKMQIVVALTIVLTATDLSLKSTADSDCQSMMASLSSCYAYIAQSSMTTPPSDCCHRADNMLQTQPICLCDILSQDGINMTRVLALPKACNLQTPPVSLCQAPPQGHQPPSGYSTKTSYSLLLSVLAAAFWAGIFLVI